MLNTELAFELQSLFLMNWGGAGGEARMCLFESFSLKHP